MDKIGREEGWISLGPWGNKKGKYWAYTPNGPILQITVRYLYAIHSILFESLSYDGVVIGSSGEIGERSSYRYETEKFCIDGSVEQLLYISVAYEDGAIGSLCFHTNLKKYGPFGLGRDASLVSFPVEGGVITGFHGLVHTYIYAIGIFVAPKVNNLPSLEAKVDSLHEIQDADSASTQLMVKNNSEEGWISVGPWGGKTSVDWDYKPDGPILQISICYGEAIDSIIFRSRSFDGLIIGSSEKIGGTGGHTIKTICIDRSVEQLSSISLTYKDYYGQWVITSLCFETSIGNKYGPFGQKLGVEVSTPIEGGVIVGFHGHAGTYLTAVGIFVAPKVNCLPSSEKKFDSLHSIQDPDHAPTQLKGKSSYEEGWMPLGPWGGKAGVDWAYIIDGPIMHIRIGYGRAINSLLCQSKSYDDMVIGSSGIIGSADGHESKTFYIDTSREQFAAITLTYGDYCIKSLYFETNLNKYGPFGLGTGDFSVSIPVEGGVLGGFHGRTDGIHITALGIFVAPKVNSLHSLQDPDSAPTQLKGKITNEEGWMTLGPWGGKDGVDWAYKVNGPIVHISIGYGRAINSILCQSKSYDNIVTGSSGEIGSKDGHVIETFYIDTSEEQLTSISLTYDYSHGKVRITTLCFYTNLNKYGPFGSRLDHNSESIPIEGGVFGGLHGRTNGRYISAIGVFVAPNVNSLHSIQDLDFAPIQLKVGFGAASKPNTLEVPTKKSKQALRLLVPKFKANFCGSKQKTRESTIIRNAASSSATPNKDDCHGGAPSPPSDMDDLHLVDPVFQIPLATNENDHPDGGFSPTSNIIHSDLILLDTAFRKAEKSMEDMNWKINHAHEKFKELQKLHTSERDSDKLQKADSIKKELRKAIAKLKVQIHLYNQIPSANSKPRHRNWDNINRAEDGLMHFFHKEEPKVAQTGNFDALLKDFHDLPEPLQDCLLCFFKFPPMATIMRTPVIYLWIGQGYVSEYLHSEGYIWDVEVQAGKIFDDLIAKGFIDPIYQNCSLVPDSCKMSFSVHYSLYREAKCRGFTSEYGTLDLDPASVCGDLIGHSCLINVGEAIISCRPKIFENMKHIQSLYLGRWQSSATHHIELANANILDGLKKLNNLTFLSLRGISMITELPTFISKLNKLMILDLRACYNLEVIPYNIGLLKNLTHLDMSECYFLENMPKSLAQLSNLQVLKGFLIGDFSNQQSCTLRDLSRLQKLRKLNIHISAKDLLSLRDLEYLERFEGLQKLTISLGRLQARAEVIAEAFLSATHPPRLQKLDLQCFPMTTLTDWLMPGKLKELKKLCIRGGELHDLGEIKKHQGEQWTVEILRLEYLSELELHWRELRILFPQLIYLHHVQCPKFINFPCDKRGVWINRMAINTHVQLQKYHRTSCMINSSSMLGLGSTSA